MTRRKFTFLMEQPRRLERYVVAVPTTSGPEYRSVKINCNFVARRIGAKGWVQEHPQGWAVLLVRPNTVGIVNLETKVFPNKGAAEMWLVMCGG